MAAHASGRALQLVSIIPCNREHSVRTSGSPCQPASKQSARTASQTGGAAPQASCPAAARRAHTVRHESPAACSCSCSDYTISMHAISKTTNSTTQQCRTLLQTGSCPHLRLAHAAGRHIVWPKDGQPQLLPHFAQQLGPQVVLVVLAAQAPLPALGLRTESKSIQQQHHERCAYDWSETRIQFAAA